MRNELEILGKRLEKIGIKIELMGNYPWVYLYSVNGVRVTERFEGNHGFTIAFQAIRPNQKPIQFTDLTEIFKILRKYGKATNQKGNSTVN
jgi:hypothetical protein